ncbi:YdcF family protein [Aureimonas mangrovi]|uniref:YdcF family protein n=1 Tax=Aureimonas mangrovi TaxID=2758041 RepID=UPI00163D6629|nr:YdcF family protein [Aureimonas mangrovi]
MFFVLSKVGWYLVQPLVVVLLLLALGLFAVAVRRLRTGLALGGLSFAILAVVALSPLGLLMMSALEERIPRPDLPAEIAGIVVLGGSFDTRIARTRGEPELNDAADRVTAALALARRYPEARIIFSGGSAALLADDIAESIPARQLFLELGLDPERLVLEEAARNTAENAVLSRKIADPQPGETWLLVTSAFHMPRAVGCFRVAGFDVLPYPVDYRTPSGSAVWQPSSASIRNVEKVHFSVREYLGLAVYWMTGRTDALFPSA